MKGPGAPPRLGFFGQRMNLGYQIFDIFEACLFN